MTNSKDQAQSVFLNSLEIPTDGERAAYVEVQCGEDRELRKEVEELLDHARRLGPFLEADGVGVEGTIAYPISEQPGTVIGPYKLLQQIGEGGMGVVFMAEQSEPIQRTVALKIIKPGMDTRQVIARFEAERQAVAMMDHPNIAKVLDAGTTDSGRPYFVMELVKGVPITKYCDEKHLPIRARLELFVQVCQAVQHAHQKGIIHRDIKPNNVLVAEYDNHAVPKVIDFGVAKATAQKLTDRTMFTEFGQVLGTMEYMSPEQSKFNQLDIDTRSDIYSLGVLLYELLAGSTPFEGKRLKDAAFDEMLRIIREEEPPKPSTRLSSIDTLPSVAANRHTEPARLSKDVQGELDWIVMKALEKDRNRRYETASGFAADIERHLHDEPVEAGPPSAAYRFRKFAKRHRTTLAAGTLIAISMLVALGGITGGIGWAMRDRTARQAKVSGQLELILDEVARLEQVEKWSEALASARRAEPALVAGEAPPDIQDRVRQTLADLELVRRLDEIRTQSGTIWGLFSTTSLAAQSDQEYTAALRQVGIDIDALPVKEAVDRIAARRPIAAALLPALDDWVAVRSLGKDEAAARRLIDVLHGADPDPWRQRMRDAVARKDWPTLQNLTTSADLDRQPAATLGFLHAAIHLNQTQFPGWAERERDLVLRRAQRKYPADFWINHSLGVELIYRQSPDLVQEGIGYMRAAVALRPESAHAVMNLGGGYRFLREHDQAIACYRKALELSPNYWACYSNLGLELGEKGRYDEAITSFEQAIKLKPDSATEAYAELSMILSNCPDAHLRNPRRAAELANKAIELDAQFSNPWIALGIARYRESKWQEARTAFDKSLQLETCFSSGTFRWAEATDWFFLTMCHQQMGQEEEARQCYEKGVAWMEKNPRISERLTRVRAEAEELLAVTPGRASHYKLGNAYACSGQWEKAAAEFQQAAQSNPTDLPILFQWAALSCYKNDQKNYQRACHALIEYFGKTDNIQIADCTVKSCALVPGFGADPAQVMRLADATIFKTQAGPVREWFELARALAQYRAERFKSAAETIGNSVPLQGNQRDVSALSILAMSQFRVGKVDEARTALSNAQRIISTKMPKVEKGETFGDDWHDWLHAQILCHEAEQVLKVSPGFDTEVVTEELKKAAGEAYREASSSTCPASPRRSVCAPGGDDFLIVLQTAVESFHETPQFCCPLRAGSSGRAGRTLMMTIVFGTVVPWLLIGIGTWLAYQLIRQNGRILLRLESIEQQIGTGAGTKRPEASRLTLGTVAPDFELPDLAGIRRKLSEFREQNVLLIFFNPQCGYCTKMAADLAALPADGGDQRAVPVVVTTGDAEENRKLVEHYGIRCLVLLQEQMEVAEKYRAQGTPMGYRVDGAGRIASELAVGAEPLLQLATTLAPDQIASGAAASSSAPHGAEDDPSLVRSRLNRSGLKAGATAPNFRLPRIDEGELSLADCRGERVLLVFSDPNCGPCDELAPRLQEIHLQQTDLQVLVVSRRDVEENRAKATKLGLTFPIVLQKQWEVSLKYAMFATPIGYLIDEQGILASDVAVGVRPILALAAKASHESYNGDSWLVGAEHALAN